MTTVLQIAIKWIFGRFHLDLAWNQLDHLWFVLVWIPAITLLHYQIIQTPAKWMSRRQMIHMKFVAITKVNLPFVMVWAPCGSKCVCSTFDGLFFRGDCGDLAKNVTTVHLHYNCINALYGLRYTKIVRVVCVRLPPYYLLRSFKLQYILSLGDRDEKRAVARKAPTVIPFIRCFRSGISSDHHHHHHQLLLDHQPCCLDHPPCIILYQTPHGVMSCGSRAKHKERNTVKAPDSPFIMLPVLLSISSVTEYLLLHYRR